MSLRARRGLLNSGLGVLVTAAAIFAILLFTGTHATARASDPYDSSVIMYNSIPNPIPANVTSVGFEAVALSQLGDGLMLSGPAGRTLDKVSVVMSSWACTSGNWFTTGSCVTTPGATYTIPITVNIYSVVSGASLEGDSPAPAPGVLLATRTQSFAIPYRPSSDSVNCDGQHWYDKQAQTCFFGLTSPITFDLSSLKVKLPSKVIVGFQYNTSDYGPSPIGDSTACHATTAGCFYDSLNVSADSNEGFYQAIGSVLDVDGIFLNFTLPFNSCSGNVPTGVFGLDATSGCWTGFHPEIQITALRANDERIYRHGRPSW
jgi:hypothetical protein